MEHKYGYHKSAKKYHGIIMFSHLLQYYYYVF